MSPQVHDPVVAAIPGSGLSRVAILSVGATVLASSALFGGMAAPAALGAT